MTISFDEMGVKVDSIDEIRQQQVDEAKRRFAPYLEGFDLQTDDSSIIGRLLSINSVPIYETAEIVPVIVSAFSLNDAQALQLDNLGQLLYNKKRNDASQAVGDVVLYGKVGVTAPVGARVKNSRTGDIYSTNREVIFSPNDVNGVDIKIGTVTTTYEISYSINGYLSDSPKIVVQKASTDITVEDINQRIIDAVNTQSSYLQASLTKDGLVKVVIKDQNRTGDFSVRSYPSANTIIENSYAKVEVTSYTYESEESLVGQIDTISTPILGWKGVTNPFVIRESLPIERDSWFRKRLKLFSLGGNSTYNSIKFALEDVSGVTYTNIQTKRDGLYITVVGGNEDEVTIAISNSVAGGILTQGDILRTVNDLNGQPHDVRFSRPKLIPIQISMSLIVAPNFPKSGQAQIKQAIVEYFNNLQVGEDVYLSRLYEPINSIKGFSVRNLKFSKLGETYHTDDMIVIGHNETATINADNIYIGGS